MAGAVQCDIVEEFEGAEFGDQRLNRRLAQLGSTMAGAPARSFPGEIPLSKRSGKVGPKQRKIHPPRKSRKARVAISATTISILRNPRAVDPSRETLALNVVRVWEPEPPAAEPPVEWLLYTSEPIETAEQILQIVDWYRARWTIEEYFKALKTGCAIEERPLGDFYALTNATAFFLPIAWKLLLLKSEAAARPLEPAATVLDADELDVLRLVARKPLPEAPTTSDVMLAIAALGGHLKHNGQPGWQTLARGYNKLQALVEGWNLRCSVETRSAHYQLVTRS